VGTFLKSPRYPIFVVSSGDHLTVLFCADRSLVRLSYHERLRDQAQRVFKLRDVHDCGFVPLAELPALLADSLRGLDDDDDGGGSVGSGGGGGSGGGSGAAEQLPAYALKFVTKRAAQSDMGVVLWKDFYDALCALRASPDPVVAFRRCFRALDPDGTGFIPNARLGALLTAVAADGVALETYDLPALTRSLDADGFGVIMWHNVEGRVATLAAVPPPGGLTGGHVGGGGGLFEIREFDMYYFNGLQRRVHGVQLGPQLQAFELRLLPTDDVRSVEQMAGTSCKLEQVVRTRFAMSVFDWRGGGMPSIDG
jgi:hypothetical protein